MNAHDEQSLTSSVEPASQPGPPAFAHGQALDEARAEFQAAWQAKQERVERVRQLAGKVAHVETWLFRLAIVFLLIATLVIANMLVGWLNLDLIRPPAYGMVACNLFGTLAGWVRTRLNRYADRLAVAEVRYPY